MVESLMSRVAVSFASTALALLFMASDCGDWQPTPTVYIPPNYAHGIPRWTPDSKQIVFERERSIYVVNINGTEAEPILKYVQGPRAETYASPSISHDGRRIAYTTTRSGETQWEVETARLDGSDRRIVASERTVITHPVWSPDGRRIAYTKGGSGLVTMDQDGSNVQELTLTRGESENWAPIGPPVWSPDERYIAFVVTEQEELNVEDENEPRTVYSDVLYTVSADGSELYRAAEGIRTVEPGDQYPRVTISPPTWSPEGLLTFGRSYREDVAGIYVSYPDGSGQRRLIGGANAQYVAWSPDGAELLFSSLDGAHYSANVACVYAVRLDGSSVRALATASLTAWAPDGSRIAFNRWGGVISIASRDERTLSVLAEPFPNERPAPTPTPPCGDPTHLVVTPVK